MNDANLLHRITELVEEEDRLRADQAATPGQHTERIRHLEEHLDQCWDLLRQRRARREFNDDPKGATMRPVKTVESYEN